jgi:hypothetical protein
MVALIDPELAALQEELRDLTRRLEAYVLAQTDAQAVPAPAPAPTPAPPPPTPTVTTTPPPAFTGDWLALGLATIDAATTVCRKTRQNKPASLSLKRNYACTWRKVMTNAPMRCNPVWTPEDWRWIMQFVQDQTCKDSTKLTDMKYLQGTFTRLGLTPHPDFDIALGTQKNKQAAARQYRRLTDAELEAALACADPPNRLVTTQLLRDKVDAALDGLIPGSPLEARRHAMLLSLFAFHGQRSQDWDVGYGGATHANATGFYCPITKVLCLARGKTQAATSDQAEWRRVFVHDTCARAIALYHHGSQHTTLLFENSRQPERRTAWMTDQFAGRDARGGLFRAYGLPHLDANKLRNMYETHIHYVLKWDSERMRKEHKAIGHDSTTALQEYSQTYRGLVTHPRGYNLQSN